MSKDTCIFTFGRCNPPHLGHGMVFDKALELSSAINAELKIFLSATVDDTKNPLPLSLKKYYIDGFFPNTIPVLQDTQSKHLFDIMTSLDGKYRNIIFIGGSDRIETFQNTLDKYNGTLYNFNSIQAIMAGVDRDISEYSSTMMRACARNNNFSTFSLALPGSDESLKYQMFNDVVSRIKK